jgi:hypothetical protein
MLRAQLNLNGSKIKTAFFKLRACWGIVFGRKNKVFLGVSLRVGLFAAIFLPLRAKKFPLLSLTQRRKI